MALHLGRRLLLSRVTLSLELGEEVKYDTQGKTPFPSGLLTATSSTSPTPPQMAGQQAHRFTSACQQPCCSELCVCRQKGCERAEGERSSTCAARNELKPVVVEERARGSTGSLISRHYPYISFSFSLLLFIVTFDF